VHGLGQCQICGGRSPTISERLGTCLNCIRERPEETLKITDGVHAKSREVFGLPSKPPKNPRGISCGLCANDCKIGMGEKGYCGLVFNLHGRLVRRGGTPERGILQWYYDPLPTNCVARWFCPGCTGAGYPKYAYERGAETGHSNLAVFYGSCSLDCLFCQNWHYRKMAADLQPLMSAESLAAKAEGHVSCICYFGGDPSSQMPHALKASEIALKKAKSMGRILRICWETSGSWRREFGLKAAELSFASGGIVKFDLKTWDENLSVALCGVSNRPALENFKMIGEKYFRRRLNLPTLTASTLLIPGYVDEEEIRNLARFIAEIDPSIPYTLLAFYPCYVMRDLPTTSRNLAYRCRSVAKEYLENVRIGNVHLLSPDSNY
jgi:pyruvate formate lyase activating enzyme